MIKTSKLNATTVGVPQHGTFWCIPASIENLLRSEALTDITQEVLIHQYLVQNVRTGKSATGQTVQLSSLPKFAVLESCRCQPIPDASFQTFAPITNAILAKLGVPQKLAYTDGITTQDDYFSKVEGILRLDKPVLISAKNQAGWHITVVYQSDGTTLWSYDPGEDRHVTLAKSEYEFSHDLLYVQ